MAWQSEVHVIGSRPEGVRIVLRSDDTWSIHYKNLQRSVLSGRCRRSEGIVGLLLEGNADPWILMYLEPSSALYGQELRLYVMWEIIRGFVPGLYRGVVDDLQMGGDTGLFLDHIQNVNRTAALIENQRRAALDRQRATAGSARRP